jgi:hypothetical protein
MASMGDGNDAQTCRKYLNKLQTAVVGLLLTSGVLFVCGFCPIVAQGKLAYSYLVVRHEMSVKMKLNLI